MSTIPDNANILENIPAPSDRRIAIHISSEAERELRKGHPWLFDQSIKKQSHAGQPGDLAIIFDKKRRFLAVGLYDPHSPIRVRILQHKEPATINQDWFKHKLEAAAQIRAPLLSTQTTGYRLVHGENDGLPGLVIDKYDQTLVLKLYTTSWIPHLHAILSVLPDITQAERLVLRLSQTMLAQPQDLYGLRDGTILRGEALKGPILFSENGLRFESDPIHGQKTGFFLDQRDNRARVEKLVAGKNVLNVFAYTGGFSLYAARGGAQSIVSLDMSKPALAAAQRNFALNQHIPTVADSAHEIMAADAFEALTQIGQTSHRFDMVIIDPPSFARKQTQTAAALAAYRKLTHLGLGVLRKRGILVQASCSSRIGAEEFFDTVNRAAVTANRPLREIRRTEHALDHPIGFTEGAYLKCLFAYA